MRKVELHRIYDDGYVSPFYWNVVTDIDTNERVMRLFGLEFGFAMEKVSDNIYKTQYGEMYTVVRN